MVYAADEVIYRWMSSQRFDERTVRRTIPLALESDEEIDFGCIFVSQAQGFLQVSLVPGRELAKRCFRVRFELRVC